VYAPAFDKVKQDLQDIIEFKEVNVEQDTENLSGEYKVKGIPMTILLEDGEVKKSKSGRMEEIELREFILN
jgi:thioredoxin-like negative regulator of GroEL